MKILIIDDNPHHAELSAITLRKYGWSAETADPSTLPHSLEEFDLVITDYSMPVRDGFAIIEWLKKDFHPKPFIMVTGHGSELIAAKAMKTGAADYVVKDAGLEYLQKLPIAVEEAIKKFKMREANTLLIEQLKKANEKLHRLTIIDEVTGVHNYRFLQLQLEKEIQRARRYLKPLSLCVLDLDGFKQINDQYGHPFGNYVLRKTATLLRREIRNVDYVSRYGGDEFIIVFPDTPVESAKTLCNRIRARIETTRFSHETHQASLTVSMGLACFEPQVDASPASLIERGDANLYEAKRQGKNRVVYRTTQTENSQPIPVASTSSRRRAVKPPPLTERRQSSRIPIEDLPVYWKFGASKYYTSSIGNISRDGILFTSPRNLSISSIINLRIQIPNLKKPIVGISEVVRTRKRSGKKAVFEIGTRFLNISKKDHQRLLTFAARKENQNG